MGKTTERNNRNLGKAHVTTEKTVFIGKSARNNRKSINDNRHQGLDADNDDQDEKTTIKVNNDE